MGDSYGCAQPGASCRRQVQHFCASWRSCLEVVFTFSVADQRSMGLAIPGNAQHGCSCQLPSAGCGLLQQLYRVCLVLLPHVQ